MKRVCMFGILTCIMMGSFAVMPAWSQAPFYEGKTITVVIGAKGSGSLIIGSQIVAHHLGKYIPGKPSVIVQNMPGADRKSTRLNSSHIQKSRMPSSA